MTTSCPIHQPVFVTAYVRFRLGQWESVRQHCRRKPQY
jgi:hypothetical protein